MSPEDVALCAVVTGYADGNRRKLIIFSEPKDTLFYLHDRVRSRLGRADAVD